MNQSQYKNFLATVPNFKEDHCFLVDPKDLVYDKRHSQIRANGHMVTKYKDFAELIKQDTEFPPISVRRLTSGGWELKEGCTRAGGAAIAGKKILASAYMDIVQNFDETEWEDWQASGNDHPNSSPNTDKDMERLISQQCANGSLRKKLKMTYNKSPENFVEKAAQHYHKDIYKHSGKDINFFRRKVKKALRGKVSSFYENYSKDEAFNFYKANNDHNFNGSKVGEIDNGRVVYTLGATNHWSPSIVGHVASKLVRNQGTKVTVVFHVKDLVGKNDDKIFEERRRIKDRFDEVNKHYGWFDELVFLPQIKQSNNKSNEEDMYNLIPSSKV